MAFHYLSLAQKHFAKFIENSPEISPKKYLYVLRGLFAAEYCLNHSDIPPLLFSELMRDSKIITDSVKQTINNLIAAKSAAQEKQQILQIPELNEFIAKNAAILSSRAIELEFKTKTDYEPLNKALLEILEH